MIKPWESIKTSSAQIPQPPYSDLPRVLCRECRPWSGRRFHQWLLQKRGWEAASISGKNYFLRVISTLKHYSDIVSDMPSGSTLSTFNYSDILSVPTEIWSSRLMSGSAHWALELAVEDEEEKRRRGEEVGQSMINSRDPHLASGEPNTDRVSRFSWEIYGNMVCWKSINISHRSGRLPGAYVFSGKTTRVFNRPHEVLEGFLTQISGSPGS